MPIKADGSMKVGTRVLTIGSASGGAGGTAYVAEGINFSYPSSVMEQKDSVGAVVKQNAFKSSVPQFTCTLQWPSSSATNPIEGHECTTTFRDTDNDGDLDAEVFFLYELGITEEQEGESKMPATFRKKLN